VDTCGNARPGHSRPSASVAGTPATPAEADIRVPAMSAAGRANTRVAAALLGTAGAIYLYTMQHLKSTAPGDLAAMDPLPPSAAAAAAAAAATAASAASAPSASEPAAASALPPK
jgi:hypothetical protein